MGLLWNFGRASDLNGWPRFDIYFYTEEWYILYAPGRRGQAILQHFAPAPAHDLVRSLLKSKTSLLNLDVTIRSQQAASSLTFKHDYLYV